MNFTRHTCAAWPDGSPRGPSAAGAEEGAPRRALSASSCACRLLHDRRILHCVALGRLLDKPHPRGPPGAPRARRWQRLLVTNGPAGARAEPGLRGRGAGNRAGGSCADACPGWPAAQYHCLHHLCDSLNGRFRVQLARVAPYYIALFSNKQQFLFHEWWITTHQKTYAKQGSRKTNPAQRSEAREGSDRRASDRRAAGCATCSAWAWGRSSSAAWTSTWRGCAPAAACPPSCWTAAASCQTPGATSAQARRPLSTASSQHPPGSSNKTRSGSGVAERSAVGLRAGNPAFKRMGAVKTRFVWDVLRLGLAVALTDADTVWLRDPRGAFVRGSLAAADVLTSSDCIEIPNDEAGEGAGECDTTVNFNTGTMLLRPTPATLAFVARWHQKARSLPRARSPAAQARAASRAAALILPPAQPNPTNRCPAPTKPGCATNRRSTCWPAAPQGWPCGC